MSVYLAACLSVPLPILLFWSTQVFTRCLRSYRWNLNLRNLHEICVNVQVKNIFSFQFERYVIFCLHVGFLEQMFSPKFRSFFQICTFQIHINFWIHYHIHIFKFCTGTEFKRILIVFVQILEHVLCTGTWFFSSRIKFEAGRPPECSFLLIHETEISQVITSFHHHKKIKIWNLTIFFKMRCPLK